MNTQEKTYRPNTNATTYFCHFCSHHYSSRRRIVISPGTMNVASFQEGTSTQMEAVRSKEIRKGQIRLTENSPSTCTFHSNHSNYDRTSKFCLDTESISRALAELEIPDLGVDVATDKSLRILSKRIEPLDTTTENIFKTFSIQNDRISSSSNIILSGACRKDTHTRKRNSLDLHVEPIIKNKRHRRTHAFIGCKTELSFVLVADERGPK